MASETVQVRLLGQFHVVSRGAEVALSPLPAKLLAYLLLGPREGRSRSVIVAQIFGDDVEAHARRRLSTVLWRLRQELHPAAGDVVRSGAMDIIAIDTRCRVEVDARTFEETLRPVLRKSVAETTDDDVRALAEAVADYRGDLLEGFYDDWMLEARDTFAWLHMSALTRLVHVHAARGELAEVQRHARSALAVEPVREDIHRALIAAYADAGRPDLAHRQFTECRALLQRELGVEPMPETVALHMRTCRGAARDPGPLTVEAAIRELEAARADIAHLSALITTSLERLRDVMPPRDR